MYRSIVLVVSLALIISPSIADDRVSSHHSDDSGETAMPMPFPRRVPVEVVNLPLDAQGNLKVVEQSTLPKPVQVVNLPTVQDVAGIVSVANLSMDAQGNLKVAVTGSRAFRFVGITTATFVGSAGRAAMTAACYAEYPGSRMAFSDEYALTVNPVPIADVAWVQPRVAVVFQSSFGSSLWVVDSAGNQLVLGDGYPATCDGWTVSSGRIGTTLRPNGKIDYDVCASMHPVACAAPEQ